MALIPDDDEEETTKTLIEDEDEPAPEALTRTPRRERKRVSAATMQRIQEFANAPSRFSTPAKAEKTEKPLGVLGTIKEGAKSTARALGATIDTYQGDEAEVVEASKAQEAAKKDPRLASFLASIVDHKRRLGPDPSLWESLKAVGSAAIDNPAGAGLMVAEQIPNSIAALGAGGAGALAGSIAGPVGTVVGGLAGLAGANIGLETGHKALEAGATGSFSPEEQERVKGEGAIKGGVITGVDTLTLGATKFITGASRRAVESATKKTLADQGIDVADAAAVKAALADPAVLATVNEARKLAAQASSTLGKRIAQTGGALALETIGEGVGEYVGEFSATGKADMIDAVLESISSLSQSMGEIAYTSALNKRAQNRLFDTEQDAEKAARKDTDKTGVKHEVKPHPVEPEKFVAVPKSRTGDGVEVTPDETGEIIPKAPDPSAPAPKRDETLVKNVEAFAKNPDIIPGIDNPTPAPTPTETINTIIDGPKPKPTKPQKPAKAPDVPKPTPAPVKAPTVVKTAKPVKPEAVKPVKAKAPEPVKPVAPVKPVETPKAPEVKKPEEAKPEIAKAPPDPTQAAKLPQHLAGAKPNYSFGTKRFTLKFDSDIDRAAYISAQTTPSKRDAEYVKFVADAHGITENEVRAHGAKVRQSIKGMAQNADAGELTVANHDLSSSAPTQTQPEAPGSDIRPHIDALIKRRAVAHGQLNRGKTFDNALKAAKDLMAGKEVSPTKFKNAAAILQDDKVSFDILNELHAKAETAKKAAKNKPKPALSRSPDRNATPERSNTESIVNSVKARWKNSPEVVVLNDMTEAPLSVRAENARQLSQGATGEPEGFIAKGKVYIVASQMKTPADVVRVLLHESLGHYGLRGTFGSSLDNVLKQVSALRRRDVEAKAKEYGLDISKQSDRLIAAEEVLAEMAETNPQNTLVQRAIAAIRTWLRQNVPGFENLNLSDAEIIETILIPARLFVQNGRFQTDTGSVAFSRSLRSGKETLEKYGLKPKGRYKTREIAAALEARQREKHGIITRKDRSEKSKDAIAEWMADEVRFEMERPKKSGVGWYSVKFQRALDIMATEFPEIATDKHARDLLTALIAITSDGQKVVPNFAMAADLYGNFRKSGKFTTERGHARQASINNNTRILQELHDTMGPDEMRAYLMEELTVSELKAIAKAAKIKFTSSYQAHIKLPRAAIVLGPKLGAFYANLMGSSGYLTMDRWWSRTFNRYRGTLLDAPTRQGLDRFKQLMNNPEMSDDEVLSAVVGPRDSYKAKGFKKGTEIEKAANTIYKAAFEGIEDAPFNTSDRTFMLDSVAKAQQKLAEGGVQMSVADIQAVLWYYEKRLYGELGARQTADVSYEEAAKRVIEERAAGAGGPGGRPVQSVRGEESIDEPGRVGEDDYEALPTEAESRVAFSRSTAAPTPTPFRERIAGITDTLIYNFQDRFKPLKDIQERAGSVPEEQDAALAEERYSGTVRARTDAFEEQLRDPLIKAIHDSGVAYEDVEDFLHALHAPSRNAAMREINPTADELKAKIDALTAERDSLASDPNVKEFLRLRKELRSAEADIEDGVADESLATMIRNEIAQLRKLDPVKNYANALEKLKGLRVIKPFNGDNTALSGMSNAESKAILDKIDANGTRKALDKISAIVDAITSRTRQIYAESGLEKADAMEAWDKKYEHYVPLHRDEVSGGTMPKTGQGFNIRGKESKRATGSNKQVTDILAHVVAQHEAAIVRSEKTRVDQTLFKFAQAHPDPELWTLDEAPMIPAIDDRTGLVVKRVDPTYKNKPEVLTLKIDGEEHTITFNDQNPEAMRLVTSMKNLSAGEMGEVTAMVGKFTRFLAQMNTTMNPVFTARNFLRDLQTAFVNLSDTAIAEKKKEVFKNVGSAIKGMWDLSKGKHGSKWAKYAEEFKNAGGQTGWMEHYKDIGARADTLRKELAVMGPGRLNSTRRTIKSLLDVIGDANGAVENGVRLSAYVSARKSGMSEGKAAQLAKNLTVNFNTHGAKGIELNAWYMFMNASIQGTARLIKALSNRQVQKIVSGVVLSGFLLDILARSMAGDEDDDGENDYDQLPEHTKAMNFIFMVDGRPVTIPMPYGYNFFAATGRKVSEMMFRENYSAVKSAADLAGIFIDAFSPTGQAGSGLQYISPTVTDPLVQWAENKNFAGNPLRRPQTPFGVPNPEYQMGFKSTSAPAKWLAEILNDGTGGNEVRPGFVDVNPAFFDFAVSSIAGGAGRTLLQTISAPIKAGSDDEIQAREVPFLNIFVGAKPEHQTERKYFEAVKKVELAKKEIKTYREKGDHEMVQQIREDRAAELRLVNAAKETKKVLERLRKRDLLLDKADPENKAALRKAIEEQKRITMSKFNKQYQAATAEP